MSWMERAATALLIALSVVAAVLVLPAAYSFGLYLAHPLVMKYGVPASAVYVGAGIRSGRYASYSHWAVLRYDDVSGGTREFHHVVGVSQLHEIQGGGSVAIHYVPGWPSTAAADEADPIVYAIAWIATGIILALAASRLRAAALRAGRSP